MTTKKPTPEERKDITVNLRQKHQPIFNALGISDAIFIPKMAHYQKGLTGLHMGFFESELEKGTDLYTEKVSMELESEDPNRTLYKVKHNPHFKEEYAASEPMPNGHCRYFIPVDELIEVTKPIESAKEADDLIIPKDPNLDLPMDQMTIRDYAAIHMREPISFKLWLNDVITDANQKPF
jgi:hypothetical protein